MQYLIINMFNLFNRCITDGCYYFLPYSLIWVPLSFMQFICKTTTIKQSLLVLLGHTEKKFTKEHSHLEIANASHAGHAEKNIYIIIIINREIHMYPHIKKKKRKLSKGCVHNQLLIKYSTELSNYAHKKIRKN